MRRRGISPFIPQSDIPNPKSIGAVAQLGEHRLCKAGVRGSSPLGSTSFWGRAKLFGLLGGVLGAARSVCSHAAEKIRSPLGLRGKPSAAALVRRDHIDPNTTCSVGNVPLCHSVPRVHALSCWGQANAVFLGSCSVCTQTAEKICSTLGLLGKAGLGLSLWLLRRIRSGCGFAASVFIIRTLAPV